MRPLPPHDHSLEDLTFEVGDIRLSLSDYMARSRTAVIWAPAGMEANGYWALDAEGGLELGGTGVSARLRDVGRFGQLVLEDGEAFSGRRVLPRAWDLYDGRLYAACDFQTPAERPLKFSNATTYAGDATVMVHQAT